jgi:hypothetical protein
MSTAVMRSKRAARAGALLAGLAMLAAHHPAFAADAAGELGAVFCAARLEDDEARVKPLLTPSLLALIDEAQARNKIVADAAPDEKPPLGDGIPYQAFPDKADTCEPGQAVAEGDRIELPLAYGFEKAPDANWTDTLLLVPSDRGLLIDDIRFQGSADGSGIVTLREILSEAFDL